MDIDPKITEDYMGKKAVGDLIKYQLISLSPAFKGIAEYVYPYLYICPGCECLEFDKYFDFHRDGIWQDQIPTSYYKRLLGEWYYARYSFDSDDDIWYSRHGD